MKILALSNLYPPDFLGGYELACAHVVDGLMARGHEVRVLTAAPRRPVPSLPHVLRRFKLIDEWNPNAMGKHLLTYRLDEVESRLVSAFNVHVLLEALREFEPDVLYVCNNIGLGGLGLMACLEYLRVPWVWQLGDCVPLLLCSTGVGQELFPTIAEEFTRRIQGDFIVVSDQLRHEIESRGVTLKGRVHTLPNWITGTPSPPRQRFYEGGHLRIMFAGQVAKFKGVDVLIASAARLRELGFEDFSLDIYGQIADPDLLHLIRKLDLSGHVSVKGSLPHAELLRTYEAYDVFAFPTLEREPFGLVPLEAVARGCVPLISRRCGIAEWLVHGVHCLKSERTAEAFAQNLAAILRGEVDLAVIGERGMTLAWRDFHLDAILPRIEQVLVQASRRSREGARSADDAYRMARLAEQLASTLILDSFAAPPPMARQCT